SLTERLFNLKTEIIKELQNLEYQEEPYIKHREGLTEELLTEVRRLSEDNFRVRMNLKYVHKYQNNINWTALTSQAVTELKEHISPLIIPDEEDEMAKRFDNVLYTIELAYLTARKATKPIKIVVETAEKLSEIGTIPRIN